MDTAPLRLRRLVRDTTRALLDLVLPPLCLNCRALVADPHAVCGPCWSTLRFLGPPHCAQCGVPFPYDLGQGMKCPACLARPPAFDCARSALAYDDASRDLILGFKHADRLETVPLFGRLMRNVARDPLEGASFLVPVPLHWRRLVARRYNQAAELAHALSKLTGVPADATGLIRTKRTRSQGEMVSARERKKNVAGAFAVTPAARARFEGRKIVLVDDVLTTGATLTACTKTLLRNGAASVSLITLARVVRPLNLTL